MELTCYYELTELERWALPALLILGGLLFLVGVILLFRENIWKSRNIKVTAKGSGVLQLPAPFALIVIGIICAGAAPYWMHHSFPEDNLVFKDKIWTLGEVHSRLKEHSRLNVSISPDLKNLPVGEVSGACWSTLLDSICRKNPAALSCPSNWHADPAHIGPR